ncbi:MAG: hypothetical protein J7K22_00695 [Nanoarchaeota archaeon]|nr:hypothetical protein [Nanoarchaeota archaeon]
MALIDLNERVYKDLYDFFSDVFYKNKSLAGYAVKLYDKISNEKFYTKNWKSYVCQIFNAYPITEDEEKILNELCKRYFKDNQLKGKKPFLKLLSNYKNGELHLTDDEVFLIKKAIMWNAAVSGYYSIINKLKSLGIIKRKGPMYVKSNKFCDSIESIRKLFNDKKEVDNVEEP